MSRLTGRVGEGNLMLLSTTGRIQFLATLGMRDPITLAAIPSFYSLTRAISYSPILSTVLGDASVSPRRACSYSTTETGLGYGIGLACMGPIYGIYGIVGPEDVFTAIVARHTYSMLIAFFPGGASIKTIKQGESVINIDSVLNKLAFGVDSGLPNDLL